MPNGITIIDKPSGWTSMDVCAPAEARSLPGTPRGFELLGRNEFALRRGFGNAKTLVTAHLRRAWRTED